MKSLPAAVALLGLAALTGCDAPTEAPILEQRWVLPVESTTISVDELLPTGVTVSGNSFRVNVDPFNASAALQDLCSACAALQGLTAPAPAFKGTITASQSLPADVSAATVTSGSVTIAITNNFNFDPIAGGGTVTVSLTDGQRPLGEAVISGTMAPGTTVTRTLTVAPGAIGKTVVATTVVDSPGGQLTTIDGARTLVVTATPAPIAASSASVNVANRSVTIDPVDLDVEDIEDSISDRIENGSILLEITNPFGVSLNASADIAYPGGTLSKPLSISSGAMSTATLSYTGDEFRSFLGRSGVLLTGTGTVSPSAGTITVTPGQRAVIKAKLDITLQIGG